MPFHPAARLRARCAALGLLGALALPAAAQGAQDSATGAAAASPSAASAPVRVTHIPEPVRQRLKDELREELLAEGRREGWARAGSVPDWLRTLRLDGDVRIRLQADDYADDNAPAINVNETNRTRALVLANNTVDRERLRVRARLGTSVVVDEHWRANVRLTTGSTTDPVSSNQTLGSYGNRFTVAFDRANARYAPGESFSAVAGRFGNPWFGTDLVWANDLGFDGVALQWRDARGAALRPWVTAAVMPVQEVELSGRDKWLLGLQLGADVPGSGRWSGRLGLGYYHYRGLAGTANPAGSSAFDYTAPAFVQKGNTLFNISSDPTRTLLALAADYHLVNATASATMPAWADKSLVVTADWVRNIGYKEAAVAQRLGPGIDTTAKVNGYLLRFSLGDPGVDRAGRWQVFVSYKHVERDAVLDAFTDSDLRGGGTDTKGVVAGATIGLARNTAVTLRWLSADTVSGVPWSQDTLQLDLQLAF